MEGKVVTRFAPSPTGFLHVGGVRTALYAWLWARKNNGKFILRIEDTDKEREVPGSIEHIEKSLKWLGLLWDEAPIIQSERLEIYKKYAEKLIEKGFAYPDPYEKDELENFRKKADEEKRPFLYREHRPASGDLDAWDGKQTLRFRTPEIKSYKWHDLVYGDLSAGPEALDDFVLIKADGFPTYNFAHIVDDIEMGVTHVMRGEEFLSSTPKFLSVYEALEIQPPNYATLPVILGPDGKKKLSKRDGAKDILDYQREGYLPEALINFLALLGWNPGTEQEIFSPEELVQTFDIARVQKSGAKLNFEKLDWINKEHIKKLPQEKVAENILALLPEKMKSKKIISVLAERISKWSEVKEIAARGELDFFFDRPEIKTSELNYKNTDLEKTRNNLKSAAAALESIPGGDWNQEKIKSVLIPLSNNHAKRGELLHPVRYALSGRAESPDPFIIAEILGKDETIARLQNAMEK